MSDNPEPTEENRIELSDNSNSDQAPEPDTNDMAEAQGTNEKETQDMKGGAPTGGEEQAEEGGKEKGSWYSQPESLGNSAGDKISSTLAPVGKYAGKGLETVSRPVGGIVEPLVGGVMKGGQAFGEQAGVGFGNSEGGPAKAAEAEKERVAKPLGGGEQTADNPLGLNQ